MIGEHRISTGIKRLFVIGSPRSGTSWLGKIFDRHPRVLYRFEPDTADHRGAPPTFCSQQALAQHRDSTRAYLEHLASVRTSKTVGTLPFFPKAYRSPPLDKLRLAMIFGLKAAERFHLCPGVCRSATIPDWIDRGPPEALVMKSIESVGRVNLYRAAWPDCRAVIIIRHPCGQIASLVQGINRHMFTSRVPISEDRGMFGKLAETEQARRRGLTLERFMAMGPIERLAWLWALPNEKAIEDVASDPNARVIRYRDLCNAPMSVAHDLFDFAGISWDPLVEQFIRESTDPAHAKNDRYYSVFRDPESSVDRWRTTLDPQDSAIIRDTVGETTPGRLFNYS